MDYRIRITSSDGKILGKRIISDPSEKDWLSKTVESIMTAAGGRPSDYHIHVEEFPSGSLKS